MNTEKKVSKEELKTIFQARPEIKRDEIVNEFVKRGYVIEGFNDVKKEPSTLQKIGTDLYKRGTNIVGEIKDTYSNINNPEKKGRLGEGLLRVTGEVAGGVTDTLGNVIGGVANTLDNATGNITSSLANKGIQSILDTDIGKQGLEYAKKSSEDYNKWKESNPDAAKNLEAVVNIANVIPIATSLKPILKTGEKVLDTAIRVGKKTTGELGNKTVKVTSQIREGISPTPTKEKAISQLLQDKTGDISKSFEEAFKSSKIDPTKISSYKELGQAFGGAIKNLSERVSSKLDDSVYKPLTSLSLSQKTTAGKEIKTNFVDKALKQLDELYTSTGDDIAKADIQDLIEKANTKGLTDKGVNDLAKLYGQEFGEKAFSKVTGDPLTSVNSQMYENIRSGLKKTARSGKGGAEAEILDNQISKIYDVKKLIDKTSDKVQDLKNKIEERGWLAKGAYTGVKLLNTITGGVIRGATDAVLNRGTGLKVLNALDLEVNLKRNLEIIEKALKSNTEKEVSDILTNSVRQGVAKQTKSQEKKLLSTSLDKSITPIKNKASSKKK